MQSTPADPGYDEEEQPTPADAASSAGGHQLADRLGQLARSLHQETPETILKLVVAAAIEQIPGTDEASLSIVTGGRKIESQAPSSVLPSRLDALQMELGEGPCLSAFSAQRTIRVPDMAAEDRWPDFARGAADAGVGSMLAFQLYVEGGDNLGALNLYSRQREAFDADSEHVGLVVAAHAAIALAEARQIGHLHQAIESRDVIGQAKGILMERYKITAHQAFLLLAKASQQANRKLHVIAEELANSGELGTGTN